MANSRINWREVERPTFRLRMRAFYNTLKGALLGESHDPAKPQFDELLRVLVAHKKNNLGDRQPDRRTIEAWRAGASPLVARHRALISAICPQALRWLDFTPVAGPLERHFYVVDGLALELFRDRDVQQEKARRADKAIDAVDLVWSCYTRPGVRLLPQSSNLRFERQLLALRGTWCGATPNKRGSKTSKGFEVPQSVSAKFISPDKYSLLPFLLAVALDVGCSNEDAFGLLAVDLATVAVAIRTRDYSGEGPFAFSGKDQFAIQSAGVSRLLWEEESGEAMRWWKLLLCEDSCQDSSDAFERLLRLRASYYSQFLQFGIVPNELQELTRLWASPQPDGPGLLFLLRNGKLLKLPV